MNLKVVTLLFAITFLFSCGKEEIFEPRILPIYPSETEETLNTSIVGKVFNKNKEPISGASIFLQTSSNSSSTVTNDKGVFEFIETNIKGPIARISIKSNGMFDAFKNIDIQDSLINYTEVLLKPKSTPLTFNSNSNGDISFSDGSNLVIPKNSIITQSGEKYEGLVNVYHNIIDPTNSNFSIEIIGGLWGISLNDSIQALTSFGMIQIELEDELGNELNLLNTKEASLTFNIPQSLLNISPEEIPFWFYDENLGIWVEEDIAIKSGNSYEVGLKHFSAFNFDLKDAPFCLSGSISHNGTPFRYTRVEATLESLGISTGGWVSDEGTFMFNQLPQGEDIKLSFYDICDNIIETKDIESINSKLTLDEIEITDIPSQISGMVFGCDGAAISNGIVYYNDVPFRISSRIFRNQTTSGFQLIHCPDAIDNNVRVFDLDTDKFISFSLSDNIDLNNIKVCDENTQFLFRKHWDKGVNCFFGTNHPILEYIVQNDLHQIKFLVQNENPSTIGASVRSNVTIEFRLIEDTSLPFTTEIFLDSHNIRLPSIPINGFNFEECFYTTLEHNNPSQFPWLITIEEYVVNNNSHMLKGFANFNVSEAFPVSDPIFSDSLFFDIRSEL